MKLLALSDIHGQFDRFPVPSLPEADLALVCGDFTNEGIHRAVEVARVERWLSDLADRYAGVLYVLGNHDLGLTDSYFELPARNCRCVTRKCIIHNAVRFVGADLSPCFDRPELAEDWERMTPDPETDAAYFDSLPVGDVIVSHCPPFGIRDEFRYPGSGHFLGSPGLRHYIETHRPRLVLCGHIHEGSGEGEVAGTRIVNVARRYEVIDL